MNQNNNNIPCTICKKAISIYRCPGCMIRTCTLQCCLTHKEQSGCNGKRNRVGFVPLYQYKDATLSSDFHFLEDVLAKSERGKRLIKDIGATVRTHSSHHNGSGSNKKRRKIVDITQGEGQDGDKDQQSGENANNPQSMPIQPLLRLKVDENDNEKETPKQNHLNLDLTLNATTLTNSNAISPSNQQNPIMHEKESKSSNKNNTPFIKLSDEEESRLIRYPPHKQKLVRQAHQRGITLLLMAPGMQRHLMNKSTKYDSKKDMIYWKVEFIIHTFERKSTSDEQHQNTAQSQSSSSTKLTITADRIPETECISTHLSKLFERNTSHSAPSRSNTRSTLLQFCCTTNTKIINENVCALLKRIPCNSSRPSYRQIGLDCRLKDVLKGMTVIEFPTIEIVLKEDLHAFPLFISEL